MRKKWPSIIRIVHIQGGIRLINETNPIVKLLNHSLDGKELSFQISDYGQLYSDIEKFNLEIIGIDFYEHNSQLTNKELPDWQPFSKMWLHMKSSNLWSNISYGSYKAKNAKLWDLASRISYQLSLIAFRLKEISNSYNSQLLSILDNNYKNELKFMNSYTWFCHMSIQSCLIDICILRDYLAEYIAKFIFNSEINITTMSGLRKKILNQKDIDESILKDPIYLELKNITDEQGWLKTLGDYRDLIIHSTPLAQAENKLFAIYKIIEIHKKEVPTIFCPIPKNPQNIYQNRSKEYFFNDFNKLFYDYIYDDETDLKIDGLNYCYQVVNLMAKLSLKIGMRSPIEPEMITFDKSTISNFTIT